MTEGGEMDDYTATPDTEAMRLSAHALLDAASQDLTEESLHDLLRRLVPTGVLGADVEVTFPLVKAAAFLCRVLFVKGAEWPAGPDVLLVVMRQGIDEQFLPGGTPPSPN
jgi:predicted RNA binding protein with dsRBD fold (UPF0201 family)